MNTRGGIVNVTYQKTAGAALAGALLCGAAGCSADSGKPSDAHQVAQKPAQVSPAVAVQRAAKQNEKITSFTYSMSGTVPGDGAVDGQVSMSVKPLATQMHLKVEGSADKESNGEMEIRLTGDGMYLNGGAEAAKEMDGKSWIKFPVSALGHTGEDGADPLGGLSSQTNKNPTDDSASLALSHDLKRVGTQTIGGVVTTHYAGTVTLDDMRKSLRGVDAETRKRREKSLKSYQDMGIGKLTMDMWIDKDDHTKRFRIRGATDKGALDTTITFLSFNKPVTVKAPPASDVLDLGDLMNDAA